MEETEVGLPSVRALGSLFKLTEVYIWDDGSTETTQVSLFPDSLVRFLISELANADPRFSSRSVELVVSVPAANFDLFVCFLDKR
ncbi:hypothetical protein LINPERHAP2_LOCUS25247 [Linum perenne]